MLISSAIPHRKAKRTHFIMFFTNYKYTDSQRILEKRENYDSNVPRIRQVRPAAPVGGMLHIRCALRRRIDMETGIGTP